MCTIFFMGPAFASRTTPPSVVRSGERAHVIKKPSGRENDKDRGPGMPHLTLFGAGGQ